MFNRQRNQDFKTVFLGSPEGKRVLAHIYKMSGMNTQIFNPGETEFRAGKHRVGQGIQGILSQDEENVTAILQQLKGSQEQTTVQTEK